MRLQKFLARAGAASRRGSEDLMTAGRVTVNGQVVTELGSKVAPGIDEICIDGIPISLKDGHSYLMLNKPAGFLTTMDDPQGRRTVRELVPCEQHPGLFPVGRLDFDTTGLLLFMTDGELAHRLLHPKHKVTKRYRVLADGVFTGLDGERLSAGIVLDDGPTQPALIKVGSVSEKQLTARERLRLSKDRVFSPYQTTVWCTITEGRKRQVKRMFAHIGHPVLALEREAFGCLELSGLRPGSWRHLTPGELDGLRQGQM
jgi:23S rRNA pseudouridine2605 synthase